MLPRENIPLLNLSVGLDLIAGSERYHGAYSLALYLLLEGAHVVWAYTDECFSLDERNVGKGVASRLHMFEFPTGDDGHRHIPCAELRSYLARLHRIVRHIQGRVVCIVHSVSDLTGFFDTGQEDEQRVALVLRALENTAAHAQVVITHQALQYAPQYAPQVVSRPSCEALCGLRHL